MEETGSAADFLPPRLTLPALREAVPGCRGCQLYKNATQAVFGEGARSATVMLVGEQPGDHEDRRGASSSTRPSLRTSRPRSIHPRSCAASLRIGSASSPASSRTFRWSRT